ncbi:MAG: hypothetical protein CMK50_05935 [Propionibacteriaceae bacterium]|jgi:uncharacterized protein (DUF1330 family)|nr:hypothetical protein [Propionibacteriaceae bacterium]MBT66419.1 hypothetical protein [Synechococcus sp. NP17]|tara:strand:- start:15283 stop:15582 length:300 start_codon:yes stop_codon:yes gene_type:complete
MAKGYWVFSGTIHTPLGMVPYISKFTSWLPTVGARLVVRDLQCDVREGAPGPVNIIVEFDSKEAAITAYESEEYKELINLRTQHSDLNLTITEELIANK